MPTTDKDPDFGMSRQVAERGLRNIEWKVRLAVSLAKSLSPLAAVTMECLVNSKGGSVRYSSRRILPRSVLRPAGFRRLSPATPWLAELLILAPAIFAGRDGWSMDDGELWRLPFGFVRFSSVGLMMVRPWHSLSGCSGIWATRSRDAHKGNGFQECCGTVSSLLQLSG